MEGSVKESAPNFPLATLRYGRREKLLCATAVPLSTLARLIPVARAA